MPHMFKALNNQQNTNFINKMHITYFTSFKNQWDLKHCRILIGSNFFFSDTQNDAPVNGQIFMKCGQLRFSELKFLTQKESPVSHFTDEEN